MQFPFAPRLDLKTEGAATVASLVLILGSEVLKTQPLGRAALFLLSGTAMVIALSRRAAATRSHAAAGQEAVPRRAFRLETSAPQVRGRLDVLLNRVGVRP